MLKLAKKHQMILLYIFAFWPVWSWYFARITDGSDEPWGVLALLTAFAFILKNSKSDFKFKNPTWPELSLLLLYIFSFNFLTPMLRAVIFVLWLTFSLSRTKLNTSLHLGVFGLLFLSLPIIASLQFFLGYPIRLATAFIASHILQVFGWHVVSQGTLLAWAGELVAVDAPCAGIKMLWSALYLCFTLSCFLKLSYFQTWLSYFLTVISVFLGNIIRTSLLFLLESKIIKLPFDAHSLTGLIVFGLVIVFVILATKTIKNINLLKFKHV